MQPPAATAFQAAVLAGRWEEALAALPTLLPCPTTAAQARWLVLVQAYLEQLEAGDTAGALGTLRGQLAPLGVNEPQLHHLAGGWCDKQA
jgi:hypothetical protein